jgi:hypothetical protein
MNTLDIEKDITSARLNTPRLSVPQIHIIPEYLYLKSSADKLSQKQSSNKLHSKIEKRQNSCFDLQNRDSVTTNKKRDSGKQLQ